MAQLELTVATRGNHAALLPVLLVVTSINEARPNPVIKVNYEDSALLSENEKAILQLNTGTKSVFGTIDAIGELCAHFPFLSGKDAKLVCVLPLDHSSSESSDSNVLHTARRTSGSLNWIP